MRRWTTAAALLLAAFALAAAGCGSDDTVASGDETTVVETATDTETQETDTATAATDTETSESVTETATSTESTETVPDLSKLSGKCKDLGNLSQEFTKAFGGTSGQGQDFSKASDAFKAFADRVPDEIRADFKVLAAAFSKYADVFKDIGLSSGKTPSPEALAKLQTALASLDQASIQKASDHIQAWVTTNC